MTTQSILPVGDTGNQTAQGGGHALVDTFANIISGVAGVFSWGQMIMDSLSGRMMYNMGAGGMSFINDGPSNPVTQELVNGSTISLTGNFKQQRLSSFAGGGSTGSSGSSSSGASSTLTGLIMPVGLTDGYSVTLLNISSGSMTFAAFGTSLVAGGTGIVIAARSKVTLVWDVIEQAWF